MNGFSRKKGICFLAGLVLLVGICACNQKQKVEEYFPESRVSQASDYSGDGFPDIPGMDLTPEIFVQMGHISGSFSYTTDLAFIHNGTHMLSGNGDGTVKLWETRTGREIRTFRCADDVTDLDVSSDDRYLVTGDRSHQNSVNVWDLATDEKLKSFRITSGCNGVPVRFLSDNGRILAGGMEETLRLWDIESGKLIREFKPESIEPHKPDVSALALTPDGRYVVAGYRYNGKETVNGVTQDVESRDNTIRVWDLETGDQILAFNKAAGWIAALTITPDGAYVLSSDWRQSEIRVWDLKTGQLTASIPIGEASAMDLSAHGRYLLLGGLGFKLIDISSGKEIRRISENGIDGWVRSIRFSPDGRYALVGDDSAKPMLWDLDSGTLVRSFGGYAGQVSAVKMSRTGHLMLTADNYNDTVAIWDLKTGGMIKTLKRDGKSIMSSATLSDDGTLAATGGWNGRTFSATVWDAATGAPLKAMEYTKQSSVHTEFLHITGDNQTLVWASSEAVVISDLSTGRERASIPDGYLDLDQIRVDPDGRYVLVTSHKTGLTAYSLPNGEKLVRLSDGNEIECIIGQNRVSVFENLTDNQGRQERWFTQFDRTSLKRVSRKKTQTYYYFGSGLEYSENALYFHYPNAKDILMYDIPKNEGSAALTGHTANLTGLDISPDRRVLCSSSRDGTARFWNPETGKEIAQFISFKDDEWIVITPEGYFNASANGAKYMNVRIGNRVYSIDQFYETYYNPAIVASVLQGQAVKPAEDIRKGVALPPQVTITSPEAGSEFKDDRIEIIVSARDMGGGIDEIRLYHNGKAVGTDTRAIKRADTRKTAKTFPIILTGGVNSFRAVGFSRDRTESNPSEITVTLLAPEKKSALYVLAVGINAYKNPALNLNYAEPDARSIADFFRQHGEDLFKTATVNDLYNNQATKKAILSGLSILTNTQPQDAVVIYLAGHGENINESWYFIPHELTYPEREEDVKENALSSAELSSAIKSIRAQKVLVLIDACKAGAVMVAFRGFEDRKALARLSRATGVHVVAASSKDQFASEVQTLGHGVFTYTLLQGLNGKAADPGQPVTVMRLSAYIDETLPELTQKYRQEPQYPVIDSKGMDFPLVQSNTH